jgi:Sensors of blue-light using FAD
VITIDPDKPTFDPGYYQLAYCSMLKQTMTQAQLDDLVAQAQAANARNGITGLMMVDDKLVVQWIEGRRDAVRGLWDKLLKDPRHYCIVELLHRDFQEQRTYPDWAMQPTTRKDMLAIVHSAREAAQKPFGLPNPWADAIAALCILIDPEFSQAYAQARPVPVVADPQVTDLNTAPAKPVVN